MISALTCNNPQIIEKLKVDKLAATQIGDPGTKNKSIENSKQKPEPRSHEKQT
jgi:hypothetical protein